ncbi:MAG: hypothetical protein GVY12_12845 [Bacteroidetes bacterium]|nr:hypothetical protein [Bacteroidota bacterium]
MAAVQSIERTEAPAAPERPSRADRLPLPPVILMGLCLNLVLMGLAILRGVTM